MDTLTTVPVVQGNCAVSQNTGVFIASTSPCGSRHPYSYPVLSCPCIQC